MTVKANVSESNKPSFNPQVDDNLAAVQEALAIDAELSNRKLELDPSGYWIVYLDRANILICAKHFTNSINQQGLAVDSETGKVIPARGKVNREPMQIFQAKTAKQLCVQIFENSELNLVSMFDHAAYIGRESQKAESALLNNQEYIQD